MEIRTAITHVHVFDGFQLSEPRTVFIQDGRIWAMISAHVSGGASEPLRVDEPADTEWVDGQGATLLPGFIDAHVHLLKARDQEDATAWGITTLLDMARPMPLADTFRHRPGLADIRSPGSPASGPGGVQTTLMGFPADTVVTGPEDAERFVSQRVLEGADYIKVILEDPALMGPAALSLETVSALVKFAHRHGKKVYAHAATVYAYQLGCDAGIDILTHVPMANPIDGELAARVHAKGIPTIPTLIMMRGMARLRAMPDKPEFINFRNSLASVRALHEAGVTIIAGTDANTDEHSHCPVPMGDSFHEELGLLVEAGLSPVEALRSATALPAQFLDLQDRGSIEVGKRADLLLVAGDPTRDISVTKNIQGVWIQGQRVR